MDTMVAVAWEILGGYGMEWSDLLSLQNWLLCFWEASGNLQMVVLSFLEWLYNHWSPWVEYREMMVRHLIGFNKKLDSAWLDLEHLGGRVWPIESWKSPAPRPRSPVRQIRYE